MGKVYEAIEKAEKERQGFAWPPNRSHVPDNNFGTDNVDADQIDFVKFSLNAPPASEFERAQREREVASTTLQSKVQPANEVSLDPTRIDPHLVTFSDLDPRAAEQYNNLAVSLIAGASERPVKRVLITSAQNGEGRTTVTLNLAAALARAKKRVLLFDCDLQRPSLLRVLGIKADAGIKEVVSGGADVGTAAVRILPQGFVLLPTRERMENSAELFASPVYRDVLHALDPHYDFILFDSSPLLKSADARFLMQTVDTAILVIRASKTNSMQMEKAIASLKQQDIFGVVLNRTRH